LFGTETFVDIHFQQVLDQFLQIYASERPTEREGLPTDSENVKLKARSQLRDLRMQQMVDFVIYRVC